MTSYADISKNATILKQDNGVVAIRLANPSAPSDASKATYVILNGGKNAVTSLKGLPAGQYSAMVYDGAVHDTTPAPKLKVAAPASASARARTMMLAKAKGEKTPQAPSIAAPGSATVLVGVGREPVVPWTPLEPSKPAKPSKPSVPWTPLGPSHHVIPWTPLGPSHTTIPWTPLEPSKPAQSGKPSQSGNHTDHRRGTTGNAAASGTTASGASGQYADAKRGGQLSSTGANILIGVIAAVVLLAAGIGLAIVRNQHGKN